MLSNYGESSSSVWNVGDGLWSVVSENGAERSAADRDATPNKIPIAHWLTAQTYTWSVLALVVLSCWIARLQCKNALYLCVICHLWFIFLTLVHYQIFFTLHDIVFNHENALIVLRGSDMHMGPCFQASEQDSLFQDQEQDPELQDKD